MKTDTFLTRYDGWLPLGCVVAAAMACAPMTLAQQNSGNSGTAVLEEQETYDFPVADTETHSRRDADSELLMQVSQQPATFIGKTVKLKNGRFVGEILDVRRKLDNLYLYFIVDATLYFNTPTTYAIPVREVEGLEGESIVMEMSEGMHVKGLTYYPEDYTNVDNHFGVDGE